MRGVNLDAEGGTTIGIQLCACLVHFNKPIHLSKRATPSHEATASPPGSLAVPSAAGSRLHEDTIVTPVVDLRIGAVARKPPT